MAHRERSRLEDHKQLRRDGTRRGQTLCSIGLGDDDDEYAYERNDLNSHTEAASKDTLHLTAQQKKDAKARARKRMDEADKQLQIARSNFIQLGGKIDETMNSEFRSERHQIK